jgi:hypothetical protein
MRIEKRDKKVYLTSTSSLWDEPKIITSFWEVKIDSELITNNQYLEKFNNVYVTKIQDRIIPLYTDEYPSFTEIIDYKPPKKTGYKYSSGEWHKIR